MIWSLQLTPWALGPLLAVLLVLRDLEYLWARRREPSVTALALLAAVSGLWALLHLLTVLSPTLSTVPLLLRVEDAALAVAPVTWLWFALAYAGRGRDLLRWPVWGVYAVSVVTLVLSLIPGIGTWVVRGTGLVAMNGLVGLRVDRGAWYVVQILVAAATVVGATAALVAYLARTPGSRARSVVAVGAGLVGVGPILAHLVWSTSADWADLSSAGFGVASALLAWGLLRQRLLTLGPVARTLVMVELQDPVVVMDGKGRVVDANRAAEHVLGLRAYGDVPVSLGTLWARTRQESETSSRIRLRTSVEAGGAERSFEVTVTSLDRRGAPGRSALVLRDVTPLLEAHAKLEKLANTDELTGLANRRHFMEALQREIDRAQRYDRPLSLVLLDLDHFKGVNDTHGHAAGDDVLRETAAILRGVCRDVDEAARIGGEELALLLPETNAAGARVMAERVRRKLEQTDLRSPDGTTYHVTASLGVAALGLHADSPDRLLQASDEALYQAKHAGRNRVVVGR